MQALAMAFSPRFIILTVAVLLTLLCLALIGVGAMHYARIFLTTGALLFGALTLLGVRDLFQTRHAVLRNYPISAHLRFLLEEHPAGDAAIFLREREGRPAVHARPARGRLSARQDGARQAPVRHAVRRLTRRATNGCAIRWRRSRVATEPLPDHGRRPGLREALFGVGLQHLGHELRRAQRQRDPRAQRAAQRKGGFAHDTGEGGFSPYHREGGGDIIWEIGSGYFGCRNAGRLVSTREISPPSPPTSRSR